MPSQAAACDSCSNTSYLIGNEDTFSVIAKQPGRVPEKVAVLHLSFDYNDWRRFCWLKEDEFAKVHFFAKKCVTMRGSRNQPGPAITLPALQLLSECGDLCCVAVVVERLGATTKAEPFSWKNIIHGNTWIENFTFA